MSLAGGEAARLGFRYEDWIVLDYLGRIVAGEFARIQFEGAIPNWTEAIVTTNSGQEHTLQAKQRSTGQWTVRRLRDDGVLRAMISSQSFDTPLRFVSNQTSALADLAEWARKSDTDEAWRANVDARGFAERLVQLQADAEIDQATAFAILKSTRFESMDAATAEGIARRSVGLHVRPTHRGEVVNKLVTGLSDGLLGRNITATTVDEFLRSAPNAIPDWRSASPQDARSKLDATVDRLGARTDLAASLERSATLDVLAAVAGNDQLVTVVAAGGMGKSVVLAQAATRLRDLGAGVAAIDARALPESLDRLPEFERAIGLPDGLVAALLVQGNAVLVLDQLDSVAPALGGSAGRWAVVEHLVDRSLDAGVTVILGCRPVNGMSNLARPEVSASEVHLVEWADEDMALLTGIANPLPSGVPRLPVFGAIWAKLNAPSELEPPNATALLTLYRDDTVRRAGLDPMAMTAVEDVLARELGERGNAPCPTERLAEHVDAVDCLVAAGYLERSVSGIAFRHEVLAEHTWASSFDRSNRDVEEILGDNSLLAHRTLRNLLQFLANGGEPRRRALARTLRECTRSTVRPAIAGTAIYWMASTDKESASRVWPVLRDLLTADPPWVRRLALRTFGTNPHFFRDAFDDDILVALAGDVDGFEAALWSAHGATREDDDVIDAFALQLAGPDRPISDYTARWWIRLTTAHPTTLMTERWTEWLRQASDPNLMVPTGPDLDGLARKSPEAAAKFLSEWLDRHIVLAHSVQLAGPFSWRYAGLPRYRSQATVPSPWILATQCPSQFVARCGDLILSCLREVANENHGISFLARTQFSADDIREPDSAAAMLVRSLQHALEIAGDEAQHFRHRLAGAVDDAAIGLVASAYTGAGADDDLAAWLDVPASANVQLTDWSRDAVIRAIRAGSASAAGRLATDTRRWGLSQRVLDDDAPDGIAKYSAPAIRLMDSEKPTGEPLDTTGWSDRRWSEAIAAMPEGASGHASTNEQADHEAIDESQLEDAAKDDPERFLQILQGPTPANAHAFDAVVRGAIKADTPPRIDIEVTRRLFAQQGRKDLDVEFVQLVIRSEHNGATEAGRDALLFAARGGHVAANSDTMFVGEHGIAADFGWGRRADSHAAAGLGLWLREHPDDVGMIDEFVDRAIENHDIDLAVGLVHALRVALEVSPSAANQRVLSLLQAEPDLVRSISIVDYCRASWRRAWPAFEEFWESELIIDRNADRAGEFWTMNRIVTSRLPTITEIASLPDDARRGIAAVVTRRCNEPALRGWAIDVLAALLVDETEAVRDEAVRWEYGIRDAARDGDDLSAQAKIPAAFRRLIPPTIRHSGQLLDVRDLLTALANGTAAQAETACELTIEMLPSALPASDLAFGYDVRRCIDVATAAHETLLNEGASAAPALTLLDALVEREPVALSMDLVHVGWHRPTVDRH